MATGEAAAGPPAFLAAGTFPIISTGVLQTSLSFKLILNLQSEVNAVLAARERRMEKKLLLHDLLLCVLKPRNQLFVTSRKQAVTTLK